MNAHRLALPAAFAVALVTIPVVAYVIMFGISWSSSQEVWGQFGDFFGGVLNPLYAMLAFFAVLWNIRLQSVQLLAAQIAQQESAASTQAQLDAIRSREARDELLAVMRALDGAIDSLYREVVSVPHSLPVLHLRHIAHEGWRLRNTMPKSGAYLEYVRNAQSPGSIVEELHSRLRSCSESLAHFGSSYESLAGASSPMAKFYRSRYLGLGQLLLDVGGASANSIEFFSNPSST
jgi:hypothetical protein